MRQECKDYADRIDAKVGIWGGERRTRTTHGPEKEVKDKPIRHITSPGIERRAA